MSIASVRLEIDRRVKAEVGNVVAAKAGAVEEAGEVEVVGASARIVLPVMASGKREAMPTLGPGLPWRLSYGDNWPCLATLKD